MLYLTRIESIDENDLQSLITGGVREGQLIDFKRDLNLAPPKAKGEFLRDVSSFANASGGDILVGVDENDGLATGLPGIQNKDFEGLEQQIAALCRSHLDPPVTGLRFRPISLNSGSFACLIRVPKTWNGPHMVTFEGEYRCWTRDNSGKRMMDLPDLRHALAYSEGAADRMKKFRMERVFNIVARETAIPLMSTQCAILHLLPLSSFTGNFSVDVLHVPDGDFPLMRSTHDKRTGSVFEGKIVYISAARGVANEYCLLFRNGCIEIVCADIIPRSKAAPEGSYFFGWHKDIVKNALSGALKLAASITIPLPIFGMLTLTGVKGYEVFPENYAVYLPPAIPLQRDILPLPEFIIEDHTASAQALLTTTFEVWWQSCGYCPQK